MYIQEEIREFLLNNIPNSKLSSGNKEIQTRCIFCGDSMDIKSKHLYIRIPTKTEIGLYNCFKCNESGIVDSMFLRSFGIYDTHIISTIIDNNKKIEKSSGIKLIDNNKIFNINNFFITQNELSEAKLKYINKRLGLELSYKDLLQNKIVLNLYDILNHNNITNLSRHVNIVNQLNESFLGFLSVDNAFVNMRNLTPGKVYETIDKRYVNYNIFGKQNNSQRYYVLPNQINLADPNVIKIHIAEGAFDILSIYYNLRKEKYNNIYAAIGGKAYLNIIKYFINKLGLFNIELHMYPDQDIDNYTMYLINNYIKPFDISLYIHRNIFPNEKDFGVSINKINESIVKL